MPLRQRREAGNILVLYYVPGGAQTTERALAVVGVSDNDRVDDQAIRDVERPLVILSLLVNVADKPFTLPITLSWNLCA